jgi:hypothetical protein
MSLSPVSAAGDFFEKQTGKLWKIKTFEQGKWKESKENE